MSKAYDYFREISANNNDMIMPNDTDITEDSAPGFLSSLFHNAIGGLEGTVGGGLDYLGAFAKSQGEIDPDTWWNGLGDWLVNNGEYLNNQADSIQQQYGTLNKYQNETLAQRLTDLDYLTDSRGLTADIFNGLGSSVPFIAASMAAPELGVGGWLARGAGGALERMGAGRLGQAVASDLVQAGANDFTRYALTSGPLEAAVNAGGIYDDLKNQGLSDSEILGKMNSMIGEELPVDMLTSGLYGAVLGGNTFSRLGQGGWKRAIAANALNTPADMLGEYMQEMTQQQLQNKYSGKPYGTFWNPTEDEMQAGRAAAMGALPMGMFGSARGAINSRRAAMAAADGGSVTGPEPVTPPAVPDPNVDPVEAAQLTGKNDDVPTADGVDVTDLDPQQYTQWYGDKLKTQGIDVPDATITVQTPKATGTTGGAKAGAGANVMDAAQDFMGQHMENGANGCVEAVTKIGARYNPFLADELSKGVVNVDTLVADAGDKVIPFDPNNLEAGDVIVYGDNDHVVLADGNGGYVGNSSSQQKVVQGGDYNNMGDLKPTKIIKTGNGVTAQNAQETTNNGGAPAADLSSLPVGDIATAIAQNTGLPANFIWAQLSHESDGGNSKLAREDHNYGGVKGNDGEYLHFDNDQQFIDYMSNYYPKYREDGIYDAQTADQFAEALQHGGYFTADLGEYEGGMHRYLEQAGLSDSGTAGAPAEKQSPVSTMTQQQFGDMLNEKMIDFAGTNDDTVKTVFNDMSTSKDKALVSLFAPYMQDGVFANTAANRTALVNNDGFKKAMSMFLSKHLSDYAPAFDNGRISFRQAEDALRPRHQVQAAQTAQAPNIQTVASPKMEAAAIQNVLSSFAQDKKNVARTEQEANLFDDMLDADDHFIDTPKNRQTLLKNYGAQLQNYVDDVMTPSLDDRVNQAIEQAIQNKDLNRMNILTQAKQANDTAALEKLVGLQTKQHVDIAAMLTPANTDVKNHVSSMMQGNALVHQTTTMEHQAPQNEVASTVQGNTPVQQAPATENEMPQGKVAPTIQANMPVNQAPAHMDNQQAAQQDAPKEQVSVTPLPTQKGQQSEGVRIAQPQQTIDEQNAQTDARIAEIKKTPLAQRKALGQQYLDTLRQNNVSFSEKKLAKSLMNGDPGAIEHVQRTYGDMLNTITPAEAAAASQHAPRTIQAATTARLGNMVSEITSGNTYKNASPVGKLAYLSAASAHAKTIGADKSARAIDSIIADVRKKAGFSGKGTTEGMTPEQKDEFYNAFYKQSLDDAMAIRKEAADEKPANLKSLDNTIEMFKQELANSKPTKEERKEVTHESTQSKSQNEPDKGTKNQDQHAKPEPRKTADTQREAEESEVSTTKKAADNGGKYVLADGYRTESGKPLLESGENEFILKPNGSKDFGEITDAISKAAKEQSGVDLAPGKIRLRVGNDKEGLLHAKKHEEQANAAGYDSTENMVADIAESFDEIYMREPVGSKTKPTFVLVKHNDRQSGKKNGIAPAYFELKQGADGNFYIVVTAIPMRDRSLKSATKKDRLIYSSPALGAASTSSSSTVSRPRSDNAGATKGVRPTSDKSSGLSTHIIPHEQKEGTKNLDTGNHHEMVEKHSQNGDTVDVVLEAQRDGVPSNLADYVRDVTREDVASIPDKRKKFIDEAIDTGAFRAIETDRGGYMLIGTKGGMFSSVTELTPAETVYYAMHGGLDFNKRSTKEAIMDDLATWYGSEKSREIKSSKANHDSEKGKNLDSTGMVTTERTSKEAADEGWQESKDETKLSAAEEQAPSGTSDEAKQVYTIVRDQLTTSKSKGAQCAASVGAAILAHHADVYAKAYSKATGKKYTAMDYLNEKFGLNMTGQPIEGRAFNQAMSKSKATSLAEFAQIATSGEVDPNGKKKTFYSVNATNDIRVDFPIDDTRHSVNKHNLTGQQLQAIEDNLENIVSAYQDTKKKGHYGGLPVLAHIVTPIGDAGITFEFSPYGRVFVTTMFFDTKQNIENWAQKNGASRSLADDKSASSFTGHPLSISTIQQKIGIGNEKVYNQTAWHGSPYDFDRFDLGAIGTGEGAQVHGWGLYFAANREVSEAYKDALSRDVVEQKHYLYLAGNKYEYPDGTTLIRADNGKVSSNPILSDVAKLIHNLGSIDAAVTRLEKLKQGDETRGNTGRSYQHVLDALKVLNDDKTYEKYEDQKRSTARLYQVDIPDADTMLDEDKPLSEQPKIMQLLDAHAEKTGDWSFSSEELDESDTGRDFYKYLKEALHSPREASKYLNAAGINGITYNGGRDGRCYVVFDDEAVSVINKYNQMVNGKVQGETAPLENGRRVVSLFEHADESTFLHEMGHVFLLDLQDLAEVDQTAANDMAAVEGWTTWKKGQAKEYKGTAWEQEFADRENAIVKAMADGDEETVNQLKDEWAQERFARGLERYLESGEAPSSKLKDVFEKFKQFLTHIYNAFKGEGGKPSEDVQNVMARMMDSDVENTVKVPPMGKAIIGRTGKETTVTTDSGKTIRVRYRLVPTARVITSHNAETMAASLFGNEEGSHVDVARSKASVQGDLKKIGKRVAFLPDNSLTSREKGIKEFGEKMGLKVVFFEGPSNLHGMYENGVSFINRSSSTSAPWTFWHETFHWLRHNNPELYRQMVSDIGKKQAFSSEQLQAYRDKTGRQALSDADVIEEMLADAMPDVHKRVSLFRDLGKADASLLQRFVGWLRDAMRAFHDALTGRKAGLSETQKAAMRDALANIAADLRDSNGKHIFKVNGAEREITAADGTKLSYPARFSGKQETPTTFTVEDRLKADSKAWKEELRKAWNGTSRGTMIPVMDTPLVLDLIGAKHLPMFLAGSKLQKIKHDHPELTKPILYKLPEYMADPMIIFKSDTVPGRIVMGLSLKDSTGVNVVVPIELDAKKGHTEMNVLTSIYGKGSSAEGTSMTWFTNNLRNGNTVYINKKQAADFYQSAGLQLPLEGRRFNDLFGSSIKTDADLVKSRRENPVRYSLDANDNSTPSLLTRAYNHLTGRKDAASHDKNVKAMLEDITKMRIRFGKLDPATEIVFKKFEGVIRARNANEWERVLPEAGRAIADRLQLQPSTAMDNYIAKWLLDEAGNDTSQEATAFKAALKNDTVLSDQLIDLKTLFNERNNREADEVVRSAIQYEKPKERTTLTKAWQNFYDEMVEELGPVKRMVEQVQKKSGQELAASVNPYIALRLFRGNAGRAMTMIEGQSEAAVKALQTNYPGVNFNGFKTLHMILDECGALHNEKRMKDFLAFALACHVKDIHTLNNRIRKSQQRLRDKIADLNDKINNLPEYQQLIESDKKVDDKYQEQREAYQKEIEGYQAKIDKAEKTIMEVPRTEDGLSLTEDRCNKVMMKYMKEYGEAQQDLVHFSKVTTSILYDAGVISKKRYKELQERWPNYIPMFRVFEDNEEVDFGDSLKHMHGSTRRIINPLDSIIRNTYDFVKKAEKNKARQLLADLTRISDVGEYIEEVDNSKPNDKTTITFYENGERKYLQTDPDIVKAVNNMGREESNWVLRLLHGPAKIARACFTTINPSFALRNLIRDSTDATIYSKYGFKPWDFVRGFLHAVHRDELFYEWLSSGAAQASAISLDRDYTQATLNQMSKTWKERLLSKEFLPAILEGMQMVGEYSEYGTRIAAYERAKKKLAGENGPHPAAYDLASAALESRDLMDFARGGRGSRYLNNVVVFANASIQGFDKFFRTFDFRKPYRKESMKALACLFLCGMLPALLLAGIHSGDDWWEELPDWQKETNWILGKVGNTIIRIPKGQDIGLRFFSNLIEKAMDRSKHKAGDYFKPVWDSLPDMIPTALLPIIEATANHSYFTGAPVVPKYQEKLPAYLQFGNETSSFAKFVGKVIGVSPRKVEHVLFGYTGNMGKGLLGVYDTIVGNQSLNTNLNEAPVISGFTAIPYKQSKTVNDFYDKFDEQQRLNEEFKLTKKKPDGYDPALYKRMTKAQQELSKINKQERAAIDDPKMDSGIREQKQLGYQQQRLSVVRRVMGQ